MEESIHCSFAKSTTKPAHHIPITSVSFTSGDALTSSASLQNFSFSRLAKCESACGFSFAAV